MKTIMGLAILLVVAVVFYLIGYLPQKQEMKRMEKHEADRCKIELRKQGGTSLYNPPGWNEKFFNYDLRSWNAGKNWYAVEYDKEVEGNRWGLIILGDAKALYPGLLEHLEGWDNLTKYVTENGPIDGADSNGINVLKKAGFTVSEN